MGNPVTALPLLAIGPLLVTVPRVMGLHRATFTAHLLPIDRLLQIDLLSDLDRLLVMVPA